MLFPNSPSNRRLTALVAVGALSLSLVSCGNSQGSIEADYEATAVTGKISHGFVTSGANIRRYPHVTTEDEATNVCASRIKDNIFFPAGPVMINYQDADGPWIGFPSADFNVGDCADDTSGIVWVAAKQQVGSAALILGSFKADPPSK